MKTSVVGAIADVGPERWAPLAAGRGLYLSYGFLAAVETSRSAATRYVLAHEGGGELVGALPLHRLDAPGEGNAAYDPYEAFGRGASVASEHADWFPCLLAGTRSGYRNELPLAHALRAEERCAVARTLVDAALELAAEEARSLAFMHLTADALHELCACSPLEGVALGRLVTAIDVEWASLEEYLATRRTKVRRDARRELRRFAAAPLEVDELALADAVALTAELIGNVNAMHGYPTTPQQLVPRLTALAEGFPQTSVVLLAREQDGGRPVALSLSFACDGELYQWAWGCDPALLRRDHEAYFNLVYYRPIAMAIERGLRRVHLGTEAYPAKLRRGATLEPRWSLFVPPGGMTDAWRAAAPGDNRRRLAEEQIAVATDLPAERWLQQAGPYAG